MNTASVVIVGALVVLLVVLPGAWLIRRKRLDEYRQYVKHRQAVAKQAKTTTKAGEG